MERNEMINHDEIVRIHEGRFAKVEELCGSLNTRLAKIEGSTSTVEILIKWVVLPLLIIVGGLVGIKMALPGL